MGNQLNLNPRSFSRVSLKELSRRAEEMEAELTALGNKGVDALTVIGNAYKSMEKATGYLSSYLNTVVSLREDSNKFFEIMSNMIDGFSDGDNDLDTGNPVIDEHFQKMIEFAMYLTTSAESVQIDLMTENKKHVLEFLK